MYGDFVVIDDVAAFVDPGGPMAVAANERGETLYLPDGRAPLYPPSLSEAAAMTTTVAEPMATLGSW